MTSDRLSALFDGELGEAEIAALLANSSFDEQLDRFRVYQLISTAMQGQLDPMSLSQANAIRRISAALSDEPLVKQGLRERLRAKASDALPWDWLMRNWFSLTAATGVAVFSGFFIFSLLQTSNMATPDSQDRSARIDASRTGMVAEASASVEQLFERRLDAYLYAHQAMTPSSASYCGGLSFLRSLLCIDDSDEKAN